MRWTIASFGKHPKNWCSLFPPPCFLIKKLPKVSPDWGLMLAHQLKKILPPRKNEGRAIKIAPRTMTLGVMSIWLSDS